MGFPGGSEVKVSASNVGDLALIPGSGRSPGEGNGNPLQYSCLENPMDIGSASESLSACSQVGIPLYSPLCFVPPHSLPFTTERHPVSLHLRWFIALGV